MPSFVLLCSNQSLSSEHKQKFIYTCEALHQFVQQTIWAPIPGRVVSGNGVKRQTWLTTGWIQGSNFWDNFLRAGASCIFPSGLCTKEVQRKTCPEWKALGCLNIACHLTLLLDEDHREPAGSPTMKMWPGASQRAAYLNAPGERVRILNKRENNLCKGQLSFFKHQIEIWNRSTFPFR